MSSSRAQRFGRYALCGEIASGGMGTVHLGRLTGPGGFSRSVAIKRMHPQFAKEPEFVAMFLDEARLAARVNHPNVASVLDVVAEADELFLVMEYVAGESLARLLRVQRDDGGRTPLDVALAILAGVLDGLHAAHEARDDRGVPLDLIHRDVSPQNVLVGTDGAARLVDFGIAKASGRLVTTREGQIKGKLGYMAPEQLRGETATRQTDVYSAAVLLWELLANRRLFAAENEGAILEKVLFGDVPLPSTVRDDAPRALDAIVARALSKRRTDRYATALEMALAVREAGPIAAPPVVGAWVERLAHDALSTRTAMLASVDAREGDSVASRTSPTDVSLALDATNGPRRTRRIGWIVAGAGVLALTGGVAIASRDSPVSPVADAASSVPTGPPAASSAVLATTVASSASVAMAEPVDPPPPSAAPPPRVAPPRAAPDGRARPRASANCAQPYVRDAAGHKIFKRECL